MNSPEQVAARKRILMIAYHFPPVRVSSGIQRTLKFCTYLREYGWDPLVLTISPRAYELSSPDQLKEIPADVIVERAFGLDTSRHLSIAGKYFHRMAQPDRWVSWWPGGIWTGMKMIRQHKPAAIFSTSPIVTAHLIGQSLVTRTGLPWIADMRDSITEPGYPRDPLTWKIHRKIEENIVNRCTKAVFTTEPTRQMYAERYPDLPESRWSVIENGFDEENFCDAETNLPIEPLGAPGQITLVHSGILYPHERDPRPFFAAIARLKMAGEIDSSRLQIILRATGNDELYKPMIANLQIGDIVRLEPVVAYRAALQEMLRADGLLLFQGSICNHQIPAKIYEYYRSGKPIFALVDLGGISAKMLRQAGANDLANIADVENIVDVIRQFMKKLSHEHYAGVARSFANTHSRKSRTEQLAQLLNGIVDSSR